MRIEKKDIEDNAEVMVSLCLKTEALAIRCLGHLLEMGVQSVMTSKDGLHLVNARLYGKSMEKVNFALYLIERWSHHDA